MDKEIALQLKECLRQAFTGLNVFVSSDPEDLPIGDPWVENILTALDKAKLVVLIATDRGLSRKWVWFEAGAGWDRRRKIVSCCVGKVQKNSLPPPFSLHTALNIDDVDDSHSFFNLLAKEFGADSGNIDHSLLIKELSRLDVRAEERQKLSALAAEEKPFFDYRQQAVSRKLDEIQQGGRDLLRLAMVYGEVDNSRIYQTWRRGYDVASTIKSVCDSGLVRKRTDRVNSMEVAWYLSVNPDLGSLLKTMLFPPKEQESPPYFQL